MGPSLRHRCLVYNGPPSAHLPEITRSIIERLQDNYRCLYLNSPSMVAGLRSYLAASGVDVAGQIDRGALILSSDQGHLIDGKFDADRMLAKLGDALQKAQADGYTGLWASGDMMWEFGNEKNLGKLMMYEMGLEALLEKQPGLCGICQYHRDALPETAVQVAFYTHQTVSVNQMLPRLNPHYRKLGALKTSPGRTTHRVDELIAKLG